MGKNNEEGIEVKREVLMELQIIDISIKDANDKIKHLENEKKLKEDKRDLVFEKTQPKATDITQERVQGGTTRIDKFARYTIECQEPEYIQLCQEIEWLGREIYIYAAYVENELKRIGEYEPLRAKIIELKDKQGLTWEQVVESIGNLYSMSQCRRIYKYYLEKRYFE